MAPKNYLTMEANIDANAREIDFVSRFQNNWDELLEALQISNRIRKEPGTQLVAYTASVTLENTVGEGEEIPYSLAEVEAVPLTDITLGKYAKAVSIEAVNKFGAELAVRKTDNAFLNELQGNVLTAMYTFLQTGTLTDSAANFQAGVAKAIGSVKQAFMQKRLGYGQIICFVNIMDAYNYLGAANLTVQSLFGIDYVENFMGADRLVLSSEIPSGTIVATPADNMILYYVDPSDANFAAMGLNYTTVGVTPLIGFHVNGNYNTAVGETFALMGMVLAAEYIDGIAVITIPGESE